jgi:hypothetical protein
MLYLIYLYDFIYILVSILIFNNMYLDIKLYMNKN